jgi:hypothetical protein
MSMSRRTQLFCDREVQGALMLRVVMYWLFCLLTITLMLVCWSVVSGPPRRFAPLMLDLYHRYAPALAASLLVLPIVMIDVVRLSNRFVGPIKRLRDGMTALAEGGEVSPMQFRDRDFWTNLAELFNVIAAKSKKPALRKHPALLATPVQPLTGPTLSEFDRSTGEPPHFFDDIVVRP